METKTGLPILSSELYSRLVNSAMHSFDVYSHPLGEIVNFIPIRHARKYVVDGLARDYVWELRKLPKTESEPSARFRRTLRDIAEAAAMRLGYHRKEVEHNSFMWAK